MDQFILKKDSLVRYIFMSSQEKQVLRAKREEYSSDYYRKCHFEGMHFDRLVYVNPKIDNCLGTAKEIALVPIVNGQWLWDIMFTVRDYNLDFGCNYDNNFEPYTPCDSFHLDMVGESSIEEAFQKMERIYSNGGTFTVETFMATDKYFEAHTVAVLGARL